MMEILRKAGDYAFFFGHIPRVHLILVYIFYVSD